MIGGTVTCSERLLESLSRGRKPTLPRSRELATAATAGASNVSPPRGRQLAPKTCVVPYSRTVLEGLSSSGFWNEEARELNPRIPPGDP